MIYTNMILTSSVDLTSSVVTNISSYDPHTHTYLTFASGYQVSMCICRPDIYGFLSTRYLWVSVIFFFLSEGKAVGKFLIAILVLLNFLKSLLTIYNFFRSLGKPVSKFLIAIPVLVNFLKSLFAIHNLKIVGYCSPTASTKGIGNLTGE